MKHILYLGLRPPKDTPNTRYTHFPVIAIQPVPWSLELDSFTHLIFTSRTAVQILPQKNSLKDKTLIAVGRATANELTELKFSPLVAQQETAEGVIDLLAQLDLSRANVLWPHSGQARSIISNYLEEKKIQYTEATLYHIVPNHPGYLPNLTEFDEVLFTSPSTVEAFLRIFKELPKNKCRAIGPVTAKTLALITVEPVPVPEGLPNGVKLTYPIQ